jgi:hypothetical protein
VLDPIKRGRRGDRCPCAQKFLFAGAFLAVRMNRRHRTKETMNMQIDWESLAATLGLLHENGESGSSDAAKRALELIIGEDTFRASVDYCIAFGRGSELARMVLWQLRPWSAMLYCYEVFRSSRPIEDRRMAVALMRAAADGRALAWVQEFLDDEDAQIQAWGAGVLDQLLWSDLITPDEAEGLLLTARKHENQAVRERAEFIRGFLRARMEHEIQRSANKRVTVKTSTGRRVSVGSLVRVTRVPPGYSELTRRARRCFRAIVGQRFRVAAISSDEPRWIELNVARVVGRLSQSRSETVWLEPGCVD